MSFAVGRAPAARYQPQGRERYYQSKQFTGRRTGWMAARSGGGRFTRARSTAGSWSTARPHKPPASLTKNSGELKGMDTSLAITGPVIATTSTNADAFVVNCIEPGNGSFNRIGRKAFMKSLRISGNVVYQGNADPTTGVAGGLILRMVVVWDKQPTGVLPVYSLMFGQTDQGGVETAHVYDQLRYDNTARFSVLRDCYITAKPNEGGSGGTTNVVSEVQRFDEFIELKNRTTVFSGDSDPCTVADISSGGLYVFFRASFASANVQDFSISADSFARLRFTS